VTGGEGTPGEVFVDGGSSIIFHEAGAQLNCGKITHLCKADIRETNPGDTEAGIREMDTGDVLFLHGTWSNHSGK
jgi:hypothetical protein